MPKVSVIIPTYNAAQYICDTIDSALAQTYQDLEIIVIDDGSTDETQKILKQYGDKIKHIYQKNNGVSSARNRGIRESKGEYIAFLDSDDIWLPGKIMNQVSLAQQNPDIDLVYSDAEIFNKRGVLRQSFRPIYTAKCGKDSFWFKISNATFNDGSTFKGNYYKDLLLGNLLTMSTVFIRKKCLDKAGNFDENLQACEDYDLWIRISRSHAFLNLNKVTTRYRFRDDSMSGELNSRSYFYQQFIAQALEKQLIDCLEIHKNSIKKRILECYKTTIWYYFNLKKLEKVRSFCLRSLHHDKFQAKLYLYLLATFFPANFIKPRTPLK